jgi:hypothetical protein
LVSRGIDFGFVREREEFTPYESLGGLEGIGLGNALLRARLTAVREVDCTTDYMSTGGQKVLRYFGTKDRGSRFFAKTLTRFSSSWFENFGAVAIQKIPSPGPPVISTLDLSESWGGISNLPSSFKSARRGSGELVDTGEEVTQSQ